MPELFCLNTRRSEEIIVVLHDHGSMIILQAVRITTKSILVLVHGGFIKPLGIRLKTESQAKIRSSDFVCEEGT